MENKANQVHTDRVIVSGNLKINNIELDVYVIEDGTPLLNSARMMALLGRPWKSHSRTDNPNFIGAKNLQPFIDNELQKKLTPIEIKDGTRNISAYHAEIIPMVAETYLKARDAGVLTESQLPIAQRCEAIIRSFAKVGITALIYEATGFEKLKKADALRLLVESYLAEEERKWTKEFPDDFFHGLDKIYGNERTVSRKRPRYYAKFISSYVYDPIENGLIYDKLKELNPRNEKGNRSKRFHQFLNEEKGLQVLRSRIWQIIAILKIASNKKRFQEHYNRLFEGDQWLFTPEELEALKRE